VSEDYRTLNRANWMSARQRMRPRFEFRLRDRPWRLAHSYTLQAVKDS
jgi:hypothetical protein